MKIISEKYVGITMESGGMLEGGRVRLGIVEKIGSKRETHWLQPSEIVAIDIKSESRERGLDWYTLEIVPAEGKGVEPVTVKASIHEFKKLKGIKESTGQSGIDENGSSGGPIALWKQMGILPRIGLVLFGVVFAGLYIVADIQESTAEPTPTSRPTKRATRVPAEPQAARYTGATEWEYNLPRKTIRLDPPIPADSIVKITGSRFSGSGYFAVWALDSDEVKDQLLMSTTTSRDVENFRLRDDAYYFLVESDPKGTWTIEIEKLP